MASESSSHLALLADRVSDYGSDIDADEELVARLLSELETTAVTPDELPTTRNVVAARLPVNAPVLESRINHEALREHAPIRVSAALLRILPASPR